MSRTVDGESTRAGSAACRVRAWWRRDAVLSFVLALSLVGAPVYLLSVAGALNQPVDAWRVVAVALLFALADQPLLETRFGHNSEAFTFAELCLVLSLVLLPVAWVVMLSASCVLSFHLVRRVDLLKAVFNAMNVAVAVACAGVVVHLVGDGDLEQTSVRNSTALLLGVAVFFLVNSLAVARAVSLSQDVALGTVYRPGLLMRVLVCGSNAAAGVAIVSLADWHVSTLLIVPPVSVLLFAAYRGYLHAAQERDVWQQLERASRELNQLDERAVAEVAIVRAAQLLKADTVEVALHGSAGGRGRLWRGDGSGLQLSGHAEGDPAEEVDGFGSGTRIVYTTPLDGPQGRIGELRVVFRGLVRLTRREQQVLHTFVHSVSSVLQNARLYEQVRAQAELKTYEASHDALTGLGNRALLHLRAQEALAQAQREGTQCALLVVDLDHFKEINDTLGHAAGDALLRQVGQRIASAVPGAEAVCRLGGDEFAVLVGGLGAVGEVDRLGGRLLEVLADPVVYDGLRLTVEGSVGIACYPADASSFEELFRRADVAMYQAKSARGQWLRYSADRDDSSVHRQALVAELRLALEDDQFTVHFQPQVDLGTGLVVGAEALCRWEHPTRGLLLPADFVGIAEQSGLVRPFTLHVLERAVAECVGWQSVGRPISVAVNLSARSLLDRQLPDDVADILARHGLPPDRLVLEITETTATSELEVVEEVLSRLRRLGVEVSVDDFGTGYSSLAFLQRTAVHELKVERAFVSGMLVSENDLALVRATVQLARSLGARSVAEGVEHSGQADALREMGCDVAQGYWLSEPLPAGGVQHLLDRRLLERRAAVPAPRTAEVCELRLLAEGA